MASPSPSPSPKPSFRSRMGTLMRRSSTGLGLGTHHKSESKTSLSDSNSSTKGSHLKVGTTIQSQIAPHTLVSPVAESPAREAEASRPSPIVAPSPLGAIPVSRPQETPADIPAVSESPAPPLPEPELHTVESPPNFVDSPKAHGPSLPVVERPSENIPDYFNSQPAEVKTPEMTSREIQEEPAPVQPQVESSFEMVNEAFGIHSARPEEPDSRPVSIPTPEPAPVVIQVPEQQLPPPTQVISDVRDLPLMGPTVVSPPPEEHSPWVGAITRTDNLSAQLRTPPNHPRSLSPKQSRVSLAGTVFESVNGSQQSIPRQVSNKPSKTSLAPSYTWSTRATPQPKPAPQPVDHGTNGDARTLIDDPFLDPPPDAQPIPYLYHTEEPSEYVFTQHYCIPGTDNATIRQSQAEPSTSHGHIAMPLPEAHEVIKNKWVWFHRSIAYIYSCSIGLCIPSHRCTAPQATKTCTALWKQSTSYHRLHCL